MRCTLGFCKGKLVWADDKDLGQRIISSSRYDEPLKNVHTTFSPCCCSNPSLLRRMLPTRIIRSRAGHTRHASKRRAPKNIFFSSSSEDRCLSEKRVFREFPSKKFLSLSFDFSVRKLWGFPISIFNSDMICVVRFPFVRIDLDRWWSIPITSGNGGSGVVPSLMMLGENSIYDWTHFLQETTETSLLNSVHQIFLLKIPCRGMLVNCNFYVHIIEAFLLHFSRKDFSCAADFLNR